MSKDNKRLIVYLGVLFIAILLTHKLPHDSYSIIQYVIKPIKIGNGELYLYGIVPLILIIISVKGIFDIEKYKNKSRLKIILIIFVIVVPLMNWTLELTRSSYHWIRNDGLNAVDIKEADMNMQGMNNDIKLNLNLELIDYGRGHNQFRIRVYLPKSLSEGLGKEFYELEPIYHTSGHRGVLNVNESIDLYIDNDMARTNIFDSNWSFEDFKCEVFNEDEVVKIINHGSR